MNVSAQLGFAFDVGKLAIANMHNAANTGRLPERTRMAREFNHRQGVDLSDAFAFGFHQNLFQQNFILHTVSKIAFPPLTLSQHLGELLPAERTATAHHAHFTQLFADPERAEWQRFLVTGITHRFADQAWPRVSRRRWQRKTFGNGHHPLTPLRHIVGIGNLDIVFVFAIYRLLSQFRLHFLEVCQRFTVARQHDG
ncbi:Uncharacterised protein [Klebsiella pneumoniae]|nr:Uncharacterised protein [Klebsiella pneumoniae]